mmetsp:Transcript_66568/g.198113  ORF Transcript_66568/g.198113 Transcript_66568/m.198113 type:complete len:230 (-) Transcript_66568:54-743(-)
MPHARRLPDGEAEDLGARLDHVHVVLPLEPQVCGRPRKVQPPAGVLQSPALRVEAVRVERPADLADDVLYHLGAAWQVPRVLAHPLAQVRLRLRREGRLKVPEHGQVRASEARVGEVGGAPAVGSLLELPCDGAPLAGAVVVYLGCLRGWLRGRPRGGAPAAARRLPHLVDKRLGVAAGADGAPRERLGRPVQAAVDHPDVRRASPPVQVALGGGRPRERAHLGGDGGA